MSKEKFFSASIGKKLIMGLTGLFLISFLLVHVSINSMMFACDGGKLFNEAASFMAHNPVIRIMEIGLFAGIIAHIVQAYILAYQNNKARPIKYAVANGGANSKWYSRSMTRLGTLLLLFLIVHLGNFWVPTKKAVFTGEEHDTFQNIKEIFQNPLLVGLYLAGVISLAYHLMHGFQSAFQTLGLNHKKYTPIIQKTGFWFSIVISLLFAAMPIGVFFGIIK